jgi:predicted ATPase
MEQLIIGVYQNISVDGAVNYWCVSEHKVWMEQLIIGVYQNISVDGAVNYWCVSEHKCGWSN